MAPLTSYGGNLIVTLDFFRYGAKYYKVTEKVDLAGLEPRDVATLGFLRASWSCSRPSPTACRSCTTATSCIATSSRATS